MCRSGMARPDAKLDLPKRRRQLIHCPAAAPALACHTLAQHLPATRLQFLFLMYSLWWWYIPLWCSMVAANAGSQPDPISSTATPAWNISSVPHIISTQKSFIRRFNGSQTHIVLLYHPSLPVCARHAPAPRGTAPLIAPCSTSLLLTSMLLQHWPAFQPIAQQLHARALATDSAPLQSRVQLLALNVKHDTAAQRKFGVQTLPSMFVYPAGPAGSYPFQIEFAYNKTAAMYWADIQRWQAAGTGIQADLARLSPSLAQAIAATDREHARANEVQILARQAAAASMAAKPRRGRARVNARGEIVFAALTPTPQPSPSSPVSATTSPEAASSPAAAASAAPGAPEAAASLAANTSRTEQVAQLAHVLDQTLRELAARQAGLEFLREHLPDILELGSSHVTHLLHPKLEQVLAITAQRFVDEAARDRLLAELAVLHGLVRELVDQDPMQTFRAALEAGRFT